MAIIAYVSGEEQFTDTDGNGEFTPGEPFVDLPEPFLDYDDDNLRDEDEPFIDIALPGHVQNEHDGPNNHWDANTIIWTETRVMWSGNPSKVDFSIDLACTAQAGAVNCGFPGNHYKIDAGQTCKVVAVVRDRNLNLVNCSTNYQWVVTGASMLDSDLVSVDCVTGLHWQFVTVPAGAAAPNVLRRRTQISSWGRFTRTAVDGRSVAPSRLEDLDRTGRFFNTAVASTTEPPAAGDEPPPYERSTIQLNLSWSTSPAANKSWTTTLQMQGCVQ